ncbi:MAG: HAD family hydrolase [Propioniciclava sp.]
MVQPDAIVFDLDGTLIDSEAHWDTARRTIASEDQVRWPEESTRATMGMSTQEWSAHLTSEVGVAGTPQEIADRVIDVMASWHADGTIAILPGAVTAVRRMAEVAPLAVASSSPRRLIDTAIGRLGITDLISVSVSTEEVARGKPAPDGFLEACRQLGADPSRCVAVEDSTNGLLSALAAGMKVVAVPPHFHPPAPETLDRVAAVIPDLDALTPALIADLFR